MDLSNSRLNALSADADAGAIDRMAARWIRKALSQAEDLNLLVELPSGYRFMAARRSTVAAPSAFSSSMREACGGCGGVTRFAYDLMRERPAGRAGFGAGGASFDVEVVGFREGAAIFARLASGRGTMAYRATA